MHGRTGDESRDLHIKDFALKGVPILVGPQSADTLRRLKILGKLQQPDQAAKPEAAPAPSKVSVTVCLRV